MQDQTYRLCDEKTQPENAIQRTGCIRVGWLPRYGVRLVIGRVLFMLPVRVFVFILELDIEFPTDELLIVELEYEFEYEFVVLDIVDELPYEFVPLIELLFI